MNAMSPSDFGDQTTRSPPANVEAEQAVLGAVMVNNDAWQAIGASLKAEHFTEEIHRRIWEVSSKLIGEGRLATPTTLRTFLGEHDLGGITVPAYLARLAGEATTIINAKDYARLIVELAARRSVIAAAQEVVEVAQDAPVDHPVQRIIEDGIGSLRAIADLYTEPGHDESVDTTFGQLIEAAQDRLTGNAVAVPSTGFVDIDRTLAGGLLPGRLIVLAGRPGMGKTVVMAAIARRAASKGAGVGVFSLEIDRKELTARLVANALASSEHPMDYRDILNGALSEETIERLCHTRERMRGLPLEVCEQAGLTMAQIETRALQMNRRLMRRGRKLDVLMIDYLQLVQVTDRYRGELVQELGEVALAAKNLSKRLGVCVVLLSQLNREVERRDNKRPVMSDLRGSGNIEEHSDAVGLLFRPEYYDNNDPKVIAYDDVACATAAGRRNLLEIHWAKNRLGPTDITLLFCDVARSQIDNHSRTREG